jgi:hypothetical protein
MKVIKLYAVTALLCLALAVCLSCGNLPDAFTPPPFSISGFGIKKGAIDKVCRVASASFYFINTSDKGIDSFTLIFRLYDAEKKPIGFLDNKVIFEYSTVIGPGEEREIVISLDRFIPQETDGSILADQIFVESVLFSDGGKWLDYFGVWGV